LRPRLAKRAWAPLVVVIVLGGAGGLGRARADGIVMLTESGVTQYQETMTGVRSRLGGNVVLIDLNSGGDPLAQLQKAHPKAVVAIGIKAASLVAHALTDVPIIYCTVLAPEQHGLIGANITGVPLEIPAAKQLEQLRDVAPKVKRIGVIHSPAVASFVTEATAAANGLGLKIVAQSVGSSREVADAFTKLTGQIDALLLLPDSKVMNKDVFSYLLRSSLDANVALFGFLEALTQAGALASISPDYQDIGARAGDLAAQALERGRGGIPQKTYSRGALSINLRTAGRLGVTVDDKIVRGAKKVFR
jgi:putative ABC transport system substrate-binding protein